VECGYIDGEVTGKERKGLLDEIREGKFRAVASVGVLTTGFDAPIVDCVVLLRPTLSASLFVQMCGRSLRPYPGKTNSLILDMAGNFDRFSCLETPLVKSSDFKEEKKAEKTEDAGTDPEVDYFLCHVCGTRLRKGARFCKYCLEIFKAVKEETWTGEEKWYGVFAIKPEDYFTAKGEKCKRVTYYINSGAVNVSEYFMIGRGGWHQRVWKKRLEQLFAGRIRAIKGKIEGRLIRVSDVEYYENQPHDLQSQPTTTGEIFV
jgi:DNA repair protein RadD